MKIGRVCLLLAALIVSFLAAPEAFAGKKGLMVGGDGMTDADYNIYCSGNTDDPVSGTCSGTLEYCLGYCHGLCGRPCVEAQS